MDTHKWWNNAKFYELYIDKFAGDIPGLIKRLDYFAHLGVNCLHILPHYPSPMVDGGYDVSDYQGVRSELGTVGDFSQLIAEAHARDIRILTDFVLNHVSSEHEWFIEARSSRTNPKRDFFLWSETGTEFAEAANPFQSFKPSNWRYNEATNDYYYCTFYPEQPDLNWDNPKVLEAMLKNMEFWIERGIDGFRLDAIPHLIKREGSISKGLPETHAIIKKIRAHLEQTAPHVALLAEAHQSVPDTMAYFGEGDECHLVYHFPLMEQMWLQLMFDEPERVTRMIEATKSIPDGCRWAVFLRNHDEISLATLPPEERATLINFLDPNHQYIFNNDKGTSMRIGSIFDGKAEKIKEAFELLYSMPGAPVMYYGDEIGMKNLPRDPAVDDTRIYVRASFDWGEAERQLTDPASLLNEVSDIIRHSSQGVRSAGELA